MRRGLVFVVLALVALSGCSRPGRRPAQPSVVVGPALPGDSIVVPMPDSMAITIPIIPQDTSWRPPVAPKTPDNPAERCILDVDGDRSQFIKDPISGRYTSYMGGGVIGRCRAQDMTIIADSAEFYDQNQLYFLIGNVKYREKRVSMDADRVTYFRAEEKLLAEGNVVAVMEDSSTMVGPRAEYYRAVRGIRIRPRIVATMRPTLTLYEKDSLGRKGKDPVVLIADNINGEGDSLFVAWGKVELDRTDLRARGDSAVLDNVTQFSRLMKAPYIESKGTDSFTLRGRVIDLFGQSRQVERVLAMDSAVAVNKELTLASDTIDLRVKENKLQRAFAFGPGAASAISSERTILADSLDVVMPDQQIREMRAVRNAYAETSPDSTKIRSIERDWLRGDTIVARFDSAAAGDTSSRPVIRALVSSGSASSYYQVPGNSGIDKPGINYVRGRQIVVDFKEQAVQTVTVLDQASGLFLEAKPDSLTEKKPPPPRRPPRAGQQPPRRVPNGASGLRRP
ncbi:MAG: LptA/OstA family protein [Gemmatimonadaceae bacterium]